MNRPAAWSDAEQRIICAAYARLLGAQISSPRRPMNKAKLCRETVPQLNNRSRGSYEFKMCNISAALRDSGNDYVTGYKPRSGYQRSLLDTLAQVAPELVPYQICTECDSVMIYAPARKPICALCRTSRPFA